MIRQILKYRGKKTFKPPRKPDFMLTPVALYANLVQKLEPVTSTYEQFHGSPKKAHGTSKPLRDMEFARHLQKVPLEYIGQWIANPLEDESYKEKVIATLRSMHTFIKSLKPDATHNTYLYPWPRRSDMFV
jgi:hypothetical protein